MIGLTEQRCWVLNLSLCFGPSEVDQEQSTTRGDRAAGCWAIIRAPAAVRMAGSPSLSHCASIDNWAVAAAAVLSPETNLQWNPKPLCSHPWGMATFPNLGVGWPVLGLTSMTNDLGVHMGSILAGNATSESSKRQHHDYVSTLSPEWLHLQSLWGELPWPDCLHLQKQPSCKSPLGQYFMILIHWTKPTEFQLLYTQVVPHY